MKTNNADDILRGLTSKVYKYVLKNGKPTGIREVQRSLKLSSPRLAFYHLNKLEEAGLLKKELEGYVVSRVVLRDSVRLRSIFIPRYFFYTVFFATLLTLQLTIFRPPTATKYYIVATIAICAALVSHLYETIRQFLKKSL
jgi:DNA-binding transcriptional ArsR family regulator